MTPRWHAIDSSDEARKVTLGACWDDYPLQGHIFCRTRLALEQGDPMVGEGLRILVQAWGNPLPYLEMAFLNFHSPVPLPLRGDHLRIEHRTSGRLAVQFSRDAAFSECTSGFYRFLGLDARSASSFYQNPTVLAPADSELAFEGYAECPTPCGGLLTIAGGIELPALWVRDVNGVHAHLDLDPPSSLWVMRTLHPLAQRASFSHLPTNVSHPS